jgi:Uma2 family endonuclease
MPELEKPQSQPELFNGPSAPRRHMTEEEFVAWCDEEDVRAEWVDGEVIVMSPVSRRHSTLFFFLAKLVSEFSMKRDLGEVHGPEFFVRFSGLRSLRLPDLLFVSKERLDLFQPNCLEGAPDLVMEIVSPDSIDRDWHEKYHEYQAAGVREYWVIDPLQKRLQAYALGAEGTYREIRETEGRVCSGVIPGFFLKSEWLWREPPPSIFEPLREMGIIGGA